MIQSIRSTIVQTGIKEFLTPTKLITDATEVIHITTADTTKQRNPSFAEDIFEDDEHHPIDSHEEMIEYDTVRNDTPIDRSMRTETKIA
jgi:hypothetical protein